MIKRYMGENIKKLRLEREMSQEELGRLCNVNYRTIGSWETNRTEPNVKNTDDLCAALRCNIEDLLPPERDHSLFDDLYAKNHSTPLKGDTVLFNTTWEADKEKNQAYMYIEEILKSSEREHFIEYLEKMHQLITLKSELNIP